MSHHHKSRRKFLKQTSCAAVGYSTLFSTLLNLKSLNAAAIANSSISADDYKALVCISLGGGNDSYNMLVPNGDAYSAYADSRSELAIAKNQLLALNDLSGNISLGLHPSMPHLNRLFHGGEAAFVANIGTLVEPGTREQFWNESRRFPIGLLSHSDQQQQWQTAVTHDRSGVGWGGRIADMINDLNSNQNISMSISMEGTNQFQTGNETVEYALGAVGANGEGAKEIRHYVNPEGYFFEVKKRAIDNLLDQTYSDLYRRTYMDVLRNSRNGFTEFNDAIKGIEFQTEFELDNEEFGGSLQMVAKTIAARETLGFKRQTFFINLDGWDHHDEVILSQERLLGILDNGINSFQNALKEIGAEDCVVSFVISDFARTLTSNGNGTDHGWGGNVMAVGGPVKGQRVYGKYPDTLSIAGDSVDDIGGGILLPSTSTDVYFAQLAEWFGVPRSSLGDIFPNLNNFYDFRNENNPLGFL